MQSSMFRNPQSSKIFPPNSAMMMGAACSYENWCVPTSRYNPEDHFQHLYRGENIKSLIGYNFLQMFQESIFRNLCIVRT